MKKASIKDVALRAGVSTASVSYVLNNSRDRISEDTILKVRKAAEELNYRPNTIAKSLKMQRTLTIGLLVADIANPYFSNIARLIEDEARREGYSLLIGSCDENKERFEQLIDTFYDRQVDGLIVTPVEGSDEKLQGLLHQNVPFVMIDRFMPSLQGNYVQINNYDTSYNATEHLLAGGRRNIVFVDFNFKLHHLLQREQGFKAALLAHNIAFTEGNIMKVDLESSDEQIAEAFTALFSQTQLPDAFLFSSNKLAIKGLKMFVKMQIKIPEDVGVICFDESEAYGLFNVPLTYVKQPIAEICAQAFQTLQNLIADQGQAPSVITFKAELVVSTSSASKSDESHPGKN